MNCMICNSNVVRLVHKRGLISICPKCKYKSISILIPSDFYEREYFNSVIMFKSKPKHMRYILRKSQAKGKILDIGCGLGLLLDEAKKIGCIGTGVEISDYAINMRKDLDIRRGFPNEEFDMVFMIGVIEHLENPQGMLEKIKKVLKGTLVITTVNSVLPHFIKPPEHICYFNRKNIRMFLENNGFNVLSISHYRINEILVIAKR